MSFASPSRRQRYTNLTIDQIVFRAELPFLRWRKISISLIDPSEGGFEFPWACGPPIEMKMGLSCACTLMERGRRRPVCTLDEVRPFLSLIRNARFEPICVAPHLGVAGEVARDGV